MVNSGPPGWRVSSIDVERNHGHPSSLAWALLRPTTGRFPGRPDKRVGPRGVPQEEAPRRLRILAPVLGPLALRVAPCSSAASPAPAGGSSTVGAELSE